MALRTRNRALLFKLQVAAGTPAVPTAGSNAILVENLQIRPKPKVIRTNEHTGSLDGAGPIMGGMSVQISGDVYLKGSGVAGTAPQWGPLLRACSWAETITAAAVPAAPEALAAGGSTTMAVLGATAVGTAQLYRGMPIVFTSAVPGTSFISDYTAAKNATLTDTLGGALIATTNYQIPINVLYAPATLSPPIGTAYVYIDGILYQVSDCRGNASLRIDSGGAGKFTFQMEGIVVSKTDAAVPTGLVYDSSQPPIWRGGKMLVNRLASAVSMISLENGNGIVLPDNPNATEGFDPAEIVSRTMTGNVDPLETLIATRDAFTDFRNGTRRIIHARLGTAAGNRFGITIPAAQYLDHQDGDRQGLATVGLPFECVGQDAGAFICQY